MTNENKGPGTPAPKKTAAERQAASTEELMTAQQEVVDLLHKNQFMLRLMTGVIIVCLAVISVAGIVGARTGGEARHISEQNNRFLNNFSNYMRCLIVNEDEVVAAVGEDKYLELCEELLFRGTGDRPDPIIVEIPKDWPTSTTTTTAGG